MIKDAYGPNDKRLMRRFTKAAVVSIKTRFGRMQSHSNLVCALLM